MRLLVLTGLSAFTVAAAAANKAPSVSITTPAPGATFTAGTNIAITANAGDQDGTIAKVEFFRGGSVLLGARTASPYTITWSNAAVGSYSLTAVATDNAGATKVSSAVTITVKAAPNTPPTVSLAAPANGAAYTSPASITLTASASDVDGTIARVEFLQNGVPMAPALTSPPYSMPVTNLGPGTYTYAARATDNAGASTMSNAATIAVGAPHQPPLVVLTAPEPCTVYDAPATVPLNADAVDPDGQVVKVEFVQGTSVVAATTSLPYAGTWTNVAPGTYTLQARATDDRGLSTSSQPVTITIRHPNQLPLISLTSPTHNARFTAPATIDLVAAASDPDGSITNVEFFANGTLLASLASPPFAYTWTNVQIGSYALTARVTDNTGAETTCTVVRIAVVNVPPTVTVTSPVAGATYPLGRAIQFIADASDTDGTITKVEFWMSGSVAAVARTAPYAVAWYPPTAGWYSVAARTYDNAGGETSSPPVSLVVVADAPPAVSLAAPAAGSRHLPGVPINLVANASDADGTVSKVEFHADNSLVGTALVAPYTATWNGAAAGLHRLTATATDNLGVTTVSAPVTIVVGIPPSIGLTAPATESGYLAPASIVVSASVVAAGTTVTSVDFHSGPTLIGSATSPPYSIVWNDVAAGRHSLTATVTDGLGGIATSMPISIVVVEPGLAILSPVDGSTVPDVVVNVIGTVQAPHNSGVTINGRIAALDGNGRFYANDVPLVDGANTLSVVLTTPGGQTATHSVAITRTGRNVVAVSATPTQGVSPLDVTLTAAPFDEVSIRTMEVDWNGDGIYDYSTTGPDWTIQLIGLTVSDGAAVFNAVVRVTDAQANVHTKVIPIVVTSRNVRDQQLRATWGAMTSALAAGNKSAAMQFLNASAQERYGRVFDVLMPEMPAITASFSPPQSLLISDRFGEYVVNRTINGENRAFLVYFTQDGDGVWRLGSM